MRQPARPDPWEAWVGDHPGPPGKRGLLRSFAADMERPLSSLSPAVGVRAVGFVVFRTFVEGVLLGDRRRRMGQDASTTSHSDIRGLRNGAEPHDRSPSRGNAVLTRESGRQSLPVAMLRRVSSGSCLPSSVDFDPQA